MPNLKTIGGKKERKQDPKGWTGTDHKKYNNAKWRKISLRKRAEKPICEYCEKEGRITKAEEVDHLRPERFWPELFNEPSNHVSTCKRCHKVKTAHESKIHSKAQWEMKARELGWI